MRLTYLEVTDLRNLEHVGLDLGSGLNYFYGDNGAGKTAILEAVALLLNGRSFRSPSIRAVIRKGATKVIVRGTLDDAARGRTEVGLSRDRSNQTDLRLNGERTRQMSMVAGLMSLQVMLPNVSDLVFEGPQNRRRVLDWGVFHVKPAYLAELQRYQRALSQRNAALKSLAASGDDARVIDALAVWTEPLVAHGVQVAEMRQAYVDALTPVFQATIGELAPELDATIDLNRGWESDTTLDDRLTQSFSVDVKSGATQAGPHRADLAIRIGGARASEVASRGQGKMLASALKLAQARLLFSEHQQNSLFLIDDLGAELDTGHNQRFFDILEGMDAQILATSINKQLSGQPYSGAARTLFHVEHGQVCSEQPDD